MDETLPGSFHLDRSRSATVQVFEHLRELIVTLAIKPGAVFPRAELSTYFALSLTPIREALTRLEEERLVDIYPQHLTRVASVDLSSARQAHFLRLALELEIASAIAASPNRRVQNILMGLIARQQFCLESGDLENFTRVDMEFHQTMYQQSDLADLWIVMRSKSGNLDRLRRLHLSLNGKAQSILEEHKKIARYIGDGDAGKARDWVRHHLSGTLHILNALRHKNLGRLLPDDYSPEALSVEFAR